MSTPLDELEAAHEQTYKKGLLSKYTRVEIFAYVLAGTSAIAATWSSIGRMFADSIENMEWVQSLKKTRDNALDKAFTVLEKNLKETPDNKLLHQQQFNEARSEIRQTYKKNYSYVLENELGVKNTFDKWVQLPRHQKIATFMTIAGILSIAGLAIYTINKERNLRKKWEEEKEKLAKEQQEHKETKADVKRIEAKIEEIKENTLPGEEPAIPAGTKTEAVLKQREAANENAIAI